MQLKWRLSHTQGYLELGMVAEAAAELRRIPPEDRTSPEILPIRMAVLQAQEKWGPLRNAARSWVRHQPDDPGGWIAWAFATRRSVSLVAAEKILRAAERLHPTNPTILFNLGCYASVRGDQPAARLYVRRSIALDVSFRELARTDPDLAGLHAEGSTKDLL